MSLIKADLILILSIFSSVTSCGERSGDSQTEAKKPAIGYVGSCYMTPTDLPPEFGAIVRDYKNPNSVFQADKRGAISCWERNRQPDGCQQIKDSQLRNIIKFGDARSSCEVIFEPFPPFPLSSKFSPKVVRQIVDRPPQSAKLAPAVCYAGLRRTNLTFREEAISNSSSDVNFAMFRALSQCASHVENANRSGIKHFTSECYGISCEIYR
jgi:hypothetical protein